MAKLHFYYSAMNAGKTTTLLQSSHNYRERGMGTLLLKPVIDIRFGKNKIGSRIGLEAEAVNFNKDDNLWDLAKDNLTQDPNMRCVLLDEAQFLTKQQVFQLTQIVDNLRIPVLAYGLRTDFKGEPFEGSQYLLAWAEELTEIKTICHCGRKATMSLKIDSHGRVIQQGEQVEIAGNERYVAVCRQHFKQGQTSSSQPSLSISSHISEEIS